MTTGKPALIVPMVAFLVFSLASLDGAAAAEAVKKYVRFLEDGGGATYGIVDGDTVFAINAAPYFPHRRTGRAVPLAGLRLLPPAQPSKVLAVALNYRSHAGDAGASKPELFAKLPSSLIGHGAEVRAPSGSRNLHFKGELVVVIGRKARDIAEHEAGRYVFGVTAGNDISDRAWQISDAQWLRAKASDGFGPVGPYLTTGLDYSDLLIETRVNGRVEQSESTRNLIHGVDKIAAYASRFFTLLPGDMIFTDMPGRTRAMASGDLVEVSVEGVGTLSNRIARP